MAKNESHPRPREGSCLWTCPSKSFLEETEMQEQGDPCPSGRCSAGLGVQGGCRGRAQPWAPTGGCSHTCIYLWDGSP